VCASCPLLVPPLHLVDETEGGPNEEQESADEHDPGPGVEGTVVYGDQHHEGARRRRSED
jgi:hypothetical protein